MIEGNGEVIVGGGILGDQAVGANHGTGSSRPNPAEHSPDRDLQALRRRLIETAVEVLADGGYPRLTESADPGSLA